MRTAYAFGLAALIGISPAMAEVVFSTGGDSARHEMRAEQDRAQARQDSAEAREQAAMGNYGAAAREQREARHEWHDANRQERKADRDSSGVTIQLGR